MKGSVGLSEEPDELAARLSQVMIRRTTMMRQPPFLAALGLLLSFAVASAQEQPQTPKNEPTASQTTGRSPATTLPETKTVAPDATGAPIEQTGKAPNVSKRMGAEMESAGDRRASPDEQ
jgi:hypothetical protein